MLAALIATIANTSGILIDKHILSREHVPYKLFVPLGFHMIFVIMLLLSPFMFQWSSDYLLTKNIISLLAVVVLAVVGNYLYFYGIESESINNAEPIIAMHAIFSVILAVIIFSDERNSITIILSLVAVVALVLSRIKKHHLSLNKFSIALLAGNFFFAIQNLFLKSLLDVYNPFTLYFVRVGIVGVIMLAFINSETKNMNQHKLGWVALSSAIVVVQLVATYWSFQQFGIVFTTLIMTAAPLMVLWGSNVFLKEKVEFRNVVATVVIVGCIIGSLLA